MGRGKPLPEVIDSENFRTCNKCKDEFADMEHNWKYRNKTKLTGLCTACNLDICRNYYHKNIDVFVIKNEQWRKENPDYQSKYYFNKIKEKK